jgi:hypothetical protein
VFRYKVSEWRRERLSRSKTFKTLGDWERERPQSELHKKRRQGGALIVGWAGLVGPGVQKVAGICCRYTGTALRSIQYFRHFTVMTDRPGYASAQIWMLGGWCGGEPGISSVPEHAYAQ